MSLDIWDKPSGYKFQDIDEGVLINLPLPLTFNNSFDDSTLLKFSIISGSLPEGLRLVNSNIFGVAKEVSRTTEFKFVIRASLGTQISDRTFYIAVKGSDEPEWVTPSGSLAIANPNQFYVLDSSYIDFQLIAKDSDTAADQILKYNVVEGNLPPGLTLLSEGRIIGLIEPALTIPVEGPKGSYGETIYDYIGYDFGERSSNGYDSYLFENTTFDFSIPGTTPKKINRYYEFVVMVTDGDSSFYRKFKIFVVGDDYFHADSAVIKAGSGTFTVDTTFVRAPIWITPKYLGIKRASNYHTYKLDIFDDKNLGPVGYELDLVNPRIKAIANTSNINENKINTNKIRIKEVNSSPLLSDKILLKNYVEKYIIPENPGDPIELIQADSTIYTITNIEILNDSEYLLTVYPNLNITIPQNTAIGIGTLSTLPPGMNFDVGSAEVFGVVPYQPEITQNYTFTAIAFRSAYRGDHIEIARSRRTFTVTVLGTEDNTIVWLTNDFIGSLEANTISNFSVKAITTIPNTTLIYNITQGSLPPGLHLNPDGEIIGKVNQYGTSQNPGLTVLDDTETTFDGSDTSFDRIYRFTVTVRDTSFFDSVDKEFYLEITTPNDELYSNIVARPYLKLNQRNLYKSFIKNSEVFIPEYIYRPNDPNFGLQQELNLLIYAGIETKPASLIAAKMMNNHKRKRFILGDLKTAQAKQNNSLVYEVIYLEVIDPLEINGKYLPKKIKTSNTNIPITVDQNEEYFNGPFDQPNPYWKLPTPLNASVDSDFVFAGDSYSEWKTPSSITLWRKIIRQIGLKDRNYLPLWMRTVQDGSVVELDYRLSIPICFCKPGTSNDVLLNIKNFMKETGFKFSDFDIEIDRYIIDSVTGYSSDKYLVFKNDRTSIS